MPAKRNTLAALQSFARITGEINEHIGRWVSWLAAAMMITQMILITGLFFFSRGSLWFQEAVIYMHGALFMLAMGYALKHSAHVRVDIFYRSMTPKQKALTDLAGVCIFLLPACALALTGAIPYALFSWTIGEGSRETSGIQAVWLLKAVIPLAFILLALQGAALAASALARLGGAKDLCPKP